MMDFPTFVALWNRVEGRTTPELHIMICRWLEAGWRGKDRRMLLLAFRNSGKSSLLALFITWALTENPALRVLILAAEQSLAEKLAANARALIERHPLAVAIRSGRKEAWAADRFTVARPGVLRDPSVLARGLMANITGVHADVIIADDVEVPNTTGTAEQRSALRRRLAELDFILEPGGGLLYAGTPHSFYSIYADQPRVETGEEEVFLKRFNRLTAPVVNANGASAWPERFPMREIEAIRRRAGPNRFRSQMLLQPVNPEDGRLDPALLRSYTGELDYSEAQKRPRLTIDGVEMVSASCWWDPAYGGHTKGDRSVVAAVFQDNEGGYWLHRVLYLSVEDDAAEDAATAQCHAVARFLAAHHLPSVTVEANGLGAFLPGLLRKALAETGVAATVRQVHSKQSKDDRILAAFDAPLAAGVIRAHASVLKTPFIPELREWRPGRNGRDDGLDAVAGAILAEPVRFGVPQFATGAKRRPAKDWRPGAGQFEADTRFTI